MAEAYLNIDKQVLDLIAYPPIFSPDVEYGQDTNYSSNNLRGKQFQFCYRYKYDTRMKSVFSPYSECLIAQGEELPNGDFVPDYTINNFIGVKVSMGHHTVEKVEVAYRIGNKGNLYVYDTLEKFTSQNITGIVKNGQNTIEEVQKYGGIAIEDIKPGMVLKVNSSTLSSSGLNGLYIIMVDVPNETVYLSGNVTTPTHAAGTWRLASSDVSIDSEYVYSIFRHDKVDYLVPEKEAIESFHGVPIKAGAFEVIESDRIVVGDVTTGYDNVDMDMDSTIEHSEIADYDDSTESADSYLNRIEGNLVVSAFYVVGFKDVIPEYSFIYISLSFEDLDAESDNEVNINASYYKNNSTVSNSEIVEYLVDKLDTLSNQNDPEVEWNDHNYELFTLTDFISKQDFEPRVDTVKGIIASRVHYYDDTWAAHEWYPKGGILKYNSRYYIAKEGTSYFPPSGGDSDNSYWAYLGSNADEIIVSRATHNDDDTARGFHYKLKSASISFYSSKNIYKTFKYGHRQNFAVEYLDYAGRPSSAQKKDSGEVYIPRINELANTYSKNNIISNVSIAIKNQPPEWAYYYRVLVDHNVPWFQQFYFNGPAHTDPHIEDDNLHLNIEVNKSIQNLRDFFPKSVVEPYLFQKGDRIRLIAYKRPVFIIAGSPPSTENVWNNFSKVYDSEIIGYDYPAESDTYEKDDDGVYIYDANNNKVRKHSTGYIIVEKSGIDYSELLTYEYILYEIYRPRKISDENTSYWETYKTFEIGNATQEDRYHKGDTDQSPDDLDGTPAEITLDFGNVYRKMRYSGEADVYFPVESLHASDYYESDSVSIGRINVISSDMRQVHEPNAYMWSGRLLEGSNINNLNTFPTENKGKLESQDSAITTFKYKGFILNAYQPLKQTSMYVGRTVLTNPDGTDEVKMITDSVFGTIRPSSQDYGCSDASSLSVAKNDIYFWDKVHSCWCRQAYNGIFPISDYGQGSYFRAINAIMGKYSDRRSLSVYDSRHDEIIASHRYPDGEHYELSVIGSYVVGDNKITGIGREGGDAISDISIGMILTGITNDTYSPTVEVNPVIINIDYSNRTIYLDRTIPFESGVSGTLTLTCSIIRKYEQVTMAFHEYGNAWKTRYPFNPEFMITFGDELLSFVHGNTYLHNSDNVSRNYFYGVQFEQWIKVPFNVDISIIKLFEGLEYVSNKRWGAISKGDIQVINLDEANIDMESKLPAVKFKNVEGKFVSELLRDMNDHNFTNENYALSSGRFLRGHVCIVKLTNFETTKTVLYEVSIYFNQSIA